MNQLIVLEWKRNRMFPYHIAVMICGVVMLAVKVVVITVRTTTFSKIWNKGYHGSVGASRWFCKIYCGKAVVVGLICVVCSKSHIVTICFFAIYG